MSLHGIVVTLDTWKVLAPALALNQCELLPICQDYHDH